MQEREDLLEAGVGDLEGVLLVESILCKKTTVQVRGQRQGLLDMVREMAVTAVEFVVERCEEKYIEPTVDEGVFLLAGVFVAFPERLQEISIFP